MSLESKLYESIGLTENILTDKIRFIRQTREGLTGEIVQRAVKALDNRDVMIRVLSTTSSNLNRFYRRKKMDAATSEELLDTICLYGEATRIFGDLELAKNWMKTPLAALAGDSPEALFDTFKGREWVTQVLNKIEYGEFV